MKAHINKVSLLLTLLLLVSPANASDVEGLSVQEMVAQARLAASVDDHDKAIELYLAAMAKDPSLSAELSLELGNQYTWAELPDSAIVWYEHRLDDHPDDMDAKIGIARAMSWDDRLHESEMYYESLLAESGDRRNDVLVGLAKVKSWQDDFGEAERIYREVLDDDPGNRDARRGMAEITHWSGRPREAQAMYRELLLEDPNDTESLKGLANAQKAAGDPDAAIETLQAEPSNDELRAAAKGLNDRGMLRGAGTFAHRENTTDGEFRRITFNAKLALANVTDAGVDLARARLTQRPTPDIDRDQFAFLLRQRFSNAFEVNVNPGYQWNRFDPVVVPPTLQTVDEFNLFIWDIYATITPADGVRFDIGNSRQSIDIPEAIFKHIDVVETSIGLDYRLGKQVVTFWEPRYAAYGDGNARFAFDQRVDWVPPIRIPVNEHNFFVVSQGLEYMSFKDQLANGYFNPSSYLHLFGGLRLVSDVGKVANINIAGRYGAEKENGQDWASVGSIEGELTIHLGKTFNLRTGYSHSGSRLETADGYRSKGFFISLDFLVIR